MNFIFSAALNKFARKYNESKDYKYILKKLGHIVSNKSQYSAYTNMFRICCLLKTENGRWAADYIELSRYNAFESLGDADSNYFALYIFLISNGKMKNIFSVKVLDCSKISERTKTYFPIQIDDLKAALIRFPDPTKGTAKISFINCGS